MSFNSDGPPMKAKNGALRIVIIYAIFSCLWVLFSDAIVALLVQEPEIITLVSTLKGWLFVAVTALLLYLLVLGLTEEVSKHTEREREARRETERTACLLETIIDSSDDAIFAKDREGRYLLFNGEAARTTGKDPSEVIGRDDTFLFPPKQAEAIRGHDQRVMNEGVRVTYEETLSMIDGDRIFQLTKGPLRRRDGLVVGLYGFSRDITGRLAAEQSLRQRDEAFRLFFEKNSSVMLLVNPISGEIIDANVEAVRYYGHDRRTLLEMSIADINSQPPEQVALQRDRAMHGERTVFIFEHRLASGELRDVEAYVTPIEIDGQPLLLSIIHDITERKQVESALRESEERLRLALSASKQGWFDVDLVSGRVRVSPEYVQMIGYDPDDFDTSVENWLNNVHPEDRPGLAQAFEQCVKEGGPHTLEYRRQTQQGEWRWIRSVGKVVEWGGNQKASRIIGIHTDISDWKHMEAHVRQLAFFDALTGLPNRRLLNDRLAQAMSASKRTGRYCALMFIDLDNFKPLNDTHGHDAGDLLLMEVATRMRSCVREADTVARFGGDEFVVMICEIDQSGLAQVHTQAHAVAEKIRQSLLLPYRITLRREKAESLSVIHHCSASIGVALFVNHELDAGEILKRADAAMYRAKEQGRNTICFWPGTSENPG